VPGERGRGHGPALRTAAIRRLAGCAIGLDGVAAQQASYRRSGSTLARRNVRRSGAPSPPRAEAAALCDLPFADLLAYDAAVAGYPRPAFLRAWTAQTSTRRGAAVVRDGALKGCGVVRDCRTGPKIGPLYADDPRTAESLLAALVARTPARPLVLDIPVGNAEAVALAHPRRPCPGVRDRPHVARQGARRGRQPNLRRHDLRIRTTARPSPEQ